LKGELNEKANSNHFVHRIIENVLYDNYHHYLQCEELPDLKTVEYKFSKYQDTVKQIEDLAEGLVTIQVDADSCPGKGSILISYPSNAIRKQIESILGGKTFYGIPVTLINQ
jgi:hypothetical protein